MKIYQSIILNLLTTSLIDCCIPTQQVETTTTPSESKSEVCQFCPRIYNIKPFDDGAGGYSLSEESSNVRYVRSGTNPHICRLSLSCPSPPSYPWVDSTPIIIIDDTKFTCVDEAGEGKWIEKGATVDAVWCAVSIFNP